MPKTSSANEVSCWNTGKSSTEQLKEMFVDIVQTDRITVGQSMSQGGTIEEDASIPGQHVARRPVFLKPHGVVQGYFEILSSLPKQLRVGVFASKKSFKAWVRFSSDTQPQDADYKTTCGVAIKLFGVEGDKLLGDGRTQDFLMQNHDVFFVDNAQEMAEFTTAGVIDKNYPAYLKAHPKTQALLNEMVKVEGSSLTATYWSVLPYAFGEDCYVKYKLVPEDQPLGQPYDSSNYLAEDLQRRLLQGPARFKFLVQFRTDPKAMPLDKATVRWDESLSPPVHVANLILPQQNIQIQGQAEYGENLAFNPWHCLPEHQPQGSISEARKTVYEASGNNRRRFNGVPEDEPLNPPSHFSGGPTKPEKKDTCIVRAAIHPSIGVARIGNSNDEYFIGPEVITPKPEEPSFYRDKKGALKRQAARFRIYGLNAKGEVVKELTKKDAE